MQWYPFVDVARISQSEKRCDDPRCETRIIKIGEPYVSSWSERVCKMCAIKHCREGISTLSKIIEDLEESEKEKKDESDKRSEEIGQDAKGT
jgi:NADH:ubiquinone oxidoreductase subunit F (NADH-binding)